jgi:CspA family cold shock protein
MEQGKIVRLTDRGFGFIARDGEDKDLFFHSNELQNVEFNDLKEGDQLQFEVSDGPKGPSAVKISRV